MKIYLDCDGVLLNWIDSYVDHLKDFWDKDDIKGKPKNWDLISFTGMTEDEIAKTIYHFNNKCWKFGCIKPVKYSKEYLKKLKHDWNAEFTVLTCCSDSESSIVLRKANLVNVFGDIFEDIICLPLHASKKDALESFSPGLFIEDKFSYALQGADAGHKTYVLRYDHNKEFEGKDERLKFVDDWKSLYFHLISERDH